GRAGGGAGAHAARGRGRHVLLVHRAVAVVVTSVAGGVGRGGRAGMAGVADVPGDARRAPGGAAGADAAGGGSGCVLLVHRAVAVVVDPVARRVRRGGRPRVARVHDVPRDAGGAPGGTAGADAAGGGSGCVLLVHRAIAVVV